MKIFLNVFLVSLNDNTKSQNLEDIVLNIFNIAEWPFEAFFFSSEKKIAWID